MQPDDSTEKELEDLGFGEAPEPEPEATEPKTQKKAKKKALPKTKRDAPDAAAKLLEAKRRRDEAERKRAEEERNAKFVHYLKCPRVPGHIAAFLTEYPKSGQWITPGHWYSQFREAGDPHQVPFIRCQECQMAGEARPWIVELRARRRPDMSFEFLVQDAMRTHILGQMSRADAEKDVTTVG